VARNDQSGPAMPSSFCTGNRKRCSSQRDRRVFECGPLNPIVYDRVARFRRIVFDDQVEIGPRERFRNGPNQVPTEILDAPGTLADAREPDMNGR
jgi:hypothetical protein